MDHSGSRPGLSRHGWGRHPVCLSLAVLALGVVAVEAARLEHAIRIVGAPR